MKTKTLNDIIGFFETGKTPKYEEFKESWLFFRPRNEKQEMTSVIGLNDALKDLNESKIDRDELINLGVGIKDYGDDVQNIADLNSIPNKHEGLAVLVINDKDANGNSYVWLYDGVKWGRTPFTALPKDVITQSKLSKKLGKSESVATSELSVINHFNELGVYSELSSLLPNDSKLNENTPLHVDEGGKGIGAGEWQIRYAADANNYIKIEGDKFIVSLDSSGGFNPSLWMLDIIEPLFKGLKLGISFNVKKISGDADSIYIALNNRIEGFVKVPLNGTQQKISTDVVYGNAFEDNRFMLFAFTQGGNPEVQKLVFEISDIELLPKEGVIQESRKNAQTLKSIGEYVPNILPSNSLLDKDTPLHFDGANKGIGAGEWEVRFATSASNDISKNDNSFIVNLSDAGGQNPSFWMLNKLGNEYKGRTFRIKFEVKKRSGSANFLSLLLNGSPQQMLTIPLTYEYQTIESDIVFGTQYNDNRLMFFLQSLQNNGANLGFEIKNMTLVDVESTLVKDFLVMKNGENSDGTTKRVKAIEHNKGINLILANFLAKLGKLMHDKDGVINILLLGDSWTHAVGKNSDGLIGYVKYLVRMLWAMYGYAGLGWYDFARANGTDMESADDEKTTLTTQGNIEYVEKNRNARGLPFAHAVMGVGASFSVEISDDAPTDSANILFDKGAKFTVSVNGGVPIEVTANNVDDYQNYLIKDNDIKAVVITSLVDGTVVYGMDLSYGTKGIKVHKVGCRGLTTRHPLEVNIKNWQTGLSKLNIDVFSVLLCTNDRSLKFNPVETGVNIDKMLKNVKEVHPLIDYVIVSPSETYASNGTHEISEYADELLKVASTNNYAYFNLAPILGTRAQIHHLDTFEDDVHPNKAACMSIANVFYKQLFDYTYS